jgi:hypothetical protein
MTSPYNPLIEDYTHIFYVVQEGDIPSIQCKMSLRGPKSMTKVDGMSLTFIDFYVPALAPRLNSTEISLQLSENITIFAVCRLYIYRCHQQRDLESHQVFGAYRTVQWGNRTEPHGTPACISLDMDISLSTETLNFL